MKVEWQPGAEDDLDAILTYIRERNPSAALGMAEALVVAGDSLATFPNRGRRGDVPGTRELAAIPPYLLIYEVDEVATTVRILRVWHGARER